MSWVAGRSLIAYTSEQLVLVDEITVWMMRSAGFTVLEPLRGHGGGIKWPAYLHVVLSSINHEVEEKQAWQAQTWVDGRGC